MSSASPVAMIDVSNSKAEATTKASTAFSEDKRALRSRAPARWSDRAREVLDDDTAPIENMIDGGIEAWAAADFAEHGSRNTHERAALERHRKDCPSALGKHGAFGGPSERVKCFGIEN
jgi:hypothetical protein